MVEIQDWIKEQLKKGYKKEQIKEGLRKAGYQQDIINSVDFLARKNKQTKQSLIALVMLLVVVVIVWLVINNSAVKKEKTIHVNIPSSFSGYNPTNLNELNTFVSLCESFLDESLEIKKEILDDENEVLCSLFLHKNSSAYVPSIHAISSELTQGKYICISVKLNNIIKEKFLDISEEEPFHVCNIIKPPLERLSFSRINPEQNLVFPEGEIFCSEAFKSDRSQFVSFSGFVPESDSFSAEIYLVPQGSIPEILNKNSFSEAKNKVESCIFLWQLERPIVSQEQR